MNTYQLECFLSLAVSLNYARTSEQMNTSQPAITRQIQSLENELGTKLFYRSTRSVELTEDGKAFIADARSILDSYNRARQKFDHKSSSHIINYTIGCSVMSHMSMLVPVMKELKVQHSAFHPTLVNLPLSRIMTRLIDGTVDIALGAKLENRSFKGCSYKELKKTRLACIFSVGHPLAGNLPNLDQTFSESDGYDKKRDITINDLQQYPSILYNPVDIPTSVAHRQRLIAGERSSSELYFCDSAEEAFVLAAAGMGVALVPEILIPDGLGDVQYRLLSDIPEISFGVYYKTGSLSTLSKDFIRVLAEML